MQSYFSQHWQSVDSVLTAARQIPVRLLPPPTRVSKAGTALSANRPKLPERMPPRRPIHLASTMTTKDFKAVTVLSAIPPQNPVGNRRPPGNPFLRIRKLGSKAGMVHLVKVRQPLVNNIGDPRRSVAQSQS